MTALPGRVQNAEAEIIKDSITDWARAADELAEAGDYATLGYGLGRIRALRQLLRDLEVHVEDHVAELMPHKRIQLDDSVLIRHNGSKRTEWQSEELLRHLIGDQVVDVRTGENVYQLLLDVLPVTKSLQWRKGKLAEYGVDVDDWSDSVPGRATVQIVEAKSDG